MVPNREKLVNTASEQGMIQGSQTRGFGKNIFRRTLRTKRTLMSDEVLKIVITINPLDLPHKRTFDCR